MAPTVSMNPSRAWHARVSHVPVFDRAANAVYARSGRVEDVAAQLGIASLDVAYRLVDENWQHRWASDG